MSLLLLDYFHFYVWYMGHNAVIIFMTSHVSSSDHLLYLCRSSCRTQNNCCMIIHASDYQTYRSLYFARAAHCGLADQRYTCWFYVQYGRCMSSWHIYLTNLTLHQPNIPRCTTLWHNCTSWDISWRIVKFVDILAVWFIIDYARVIHLFASIFSRFYLAWAIRCNGIRPALRKSTAVRVLWLPRIRCSGI